MTASLRFEVHTERREGLTRDLPPGSEEWRWVANSATLIVGEHEAVLVDTFTTVAQNERLIEWIRAHNTTLSTVYLTHGHGDHAYGIGQLRAAFPGVRVLGTTGTLAKLEEQARPEWRDDFWGRLFPGQIPEVEFPEVIEGGFTLEGHNLSVVEAGDTDTEGTTSLWVPDAGLVVAGDVVYNATYPYLAETTAESRLNWVAALERLRELDPAWVVSGHKQPDRPDSPSDIEATIQYFTDVEETEITPDDPLGFYERMLAKQPGRANIGSLWGAAKAITAERS